MKKRTNTTILLLAAALLAPCPGCMEGPVDISPIFAGKSAEEGDIRDSMLRFEEEYGVVIEWGFLESEYSPVGSGLTLPYTRVTDYEGVLEMAKFIEQEIFARFPPGFIKEYMPRNVFLVDSLISIYSHEDDVKGVEWEKHTDVPCNLTDRYVVIGNVDGFNRAALTQGQKASLVEYLFSLFVENLFNNNRVPPIPAAFKAATEKACTDVGAVIYSGVNNSPNSNYPWWEGRPQFYAWPGVGSDSLATPWFGRGILKPGRLGLLAYDHEVLMGLDLESYEIHRGTLEQDFGDFTTFVFLTPPEYRESFYAGVETITKVAAYTGYEPDPRFPHGGPAGAAAMRTKDEVVRGYWKEHFGINLE
jgi:hypothetical protein